MSKYPSDEIDINPEYKPFPVCPHCKTVMYKKYTGYKDNEIVECDVCRGSFMVEIKKEYKTSIPKPEDLE